MGWEKDKKFKGQNTDLHMNRGDKDKKFNDQNTDLHVGECGIVSVPNTPSSHLSIIIVVRSILENTI